ncbi:hypothetical protein INT45_009020 [Circinella minor]|uniref:Reverse transcriptase domain-containing protein n=1 Tax=Circinella minor TaxID=1195481 RepID=A0A8H7VL77_9FUNG|nr:hypothetical protein INT45_009020 [Circinella minor]
MSGPTLIIGDFNLHLHEVVPVAIRPWTQFLYDNYANCFSLDQPDVLAPSSAAPTFTRGTQRTIIDYMFIQAKHRSCVIHTEQQPVSWSDHEILMLDYKINSLDCGPGVWRFNSTLLDHEELRLLLHEAITQFLDMTDHLTISPDLQWDQLKTVIKETAVQYSRRHSSYFKKRTRELHQRRHKIIGQHGSAYSTPLNEIDKEIKNFQEIQTKQLLLRTATQWHEKGERNNKQEAVTITSLRDPITGIQATTNGEIFGMAHAFYDTLFAPEPVSNEAIQSILSSIPPEKTLSPNQQANLTSVFTLAELIEALKHSPLGKSPGLDGLSFEVCRFLLSHARCLELLLKVLNLALQEAIYPLSWMRTRMVLLFKKGDPQLLSNWRPLSLINSDAKIFTKLLANRTQPLLQHLINPYQTGFLANRLISDHGWAVQNLMGHARKAASTNPNFQTGVGIMLDQQKAYDMVHPEYLKQTLARFGFPPMFITSITSLFFSTSIFLSINGWLSEPVCQLRGLRQGDPISPLLFNIAFEPLLYTIINDPLIQGAPLAPLPPRSNIHFRSNSSFDSSHPIKICAYADDLLVFLHQPQEWNHLVRHLTVYGQASNGRVNLQKTVVFPLNGELHEDWRTQVESFGARWHDQHHPHALTYLGYPLYHSQAQLDGFLESLYNKIKHHVDFLQQRRLSVLGKSIIANSLLLSRLWHVLRVCIVPTSWLKKCNSLVRQYVLDFFPYPRWSHVNASKSHGGLAIVDLHDQYAALHHKYIQHLFITPTTQHPASYITLLLQQLFNIYTGQPSPYAILFTIPSFQRLCSPLPHLVHLIKLIPRLPIFSLPTTTPLAAIMDLPLCTVITQTSDNTNLLPTSPRYLVSDAYSFSSTSLSILQPTQLGRIPTTITRLHSEVILGHVQLHSVIDHALQDTQPLSLPTSETTTRIPMSHWTLPPPRSFTTSRRVALKRINVLHVGPGRLRRFWRESSLSSSPSSSQLITSTLLPKDWRLFWRTDIPHGARTAWWRLLLQRVSNKAHLHHIMPEKHPTNICPICEVEPDTVRHFFVDCPLKFAFWQQTLATLASAPLLSTDHLWDLLHLRFTHDNIHWSAHLPNFGLILQTIWSMHWRSIFQNLPWNTIIASQFYQQLLSRYPFIITSLSPSSTNISHIQIEDQLPQ